VGRIIALGSLALPLIAADCNPSTNPTITVREKRSVTGTLKGVTVNGNGFTANGDLLLRYFVLPPGGAFVPVPGRAGRAGADGKFQIDHEPVCPNLSVLGVPRASFVTVIVEDVKSGETDVENLNPGSNSDCVAI